MQRSNKISLAKANQTL